MSSYEIALALFFLTALVALSRLRKPLMAVDLSSARAIAIGVVILAAASTGSVVVRSGLHPKVSQFVDPGFLGLLYWIGIVAGIAFLTSGLSAWLPLSRRFRATQQTALARARLVRHTDQLLRVEHRIDVVLTKTLEHIVASYQLQRGAVHLYSETTGALAFLAGRTGDGREWNEVGLARLNSRVELPDDLLLTATEGLFEDIASLERLPDLAVGLMVQGQLYAVVTLWRDRQSELVDEDLMNLKLVAAVITQHLEAQRLRIRGEFLDQAFSLAGRAYALVDRSVSARSCLSGLKELLAEHIPVDQAMLTICASDFGCQRLTVSQAGSVLHEVTADVEQTDPIAAEVLRGSERVVIRSAESAPASHKEWLNKFRFQSVIAEPLTIDGRCAGVFAIASRAGGALGSQAAALLAAQRPALSLLAASEIKRYRRQQYGMQLQTIAELAAELAGFATLRDAYARICQVLSRELRSTHVRISSVDSSGHFLVSRALTAARVDAGSPGGQATLILTAMPVHRKVIESARAMVINVEGDAATMPRTEQMQAFGSTIGSAMLIPITAAGKVIGVISIGEERNWQRRSWLESDLLFASAVAAVFGTHLDGRLSARREKKRVQPETRTGLTLKRGSESVEAAPIEPVAGDIRTRKAIANRVLELSHINA